MDFSEYARGRVQGPGQVLESWRVEVSGAALQAEYRDHFGNETALYLLAPGVREIDITSEGQPRDRGPGRDDRDS